MSHPLARRMARLERRVQVRPRLPSAAELLAEDEAGTSRADWSRDVDARIDPLFGGSHAWARDTLATLARETGTSPRLVTRAVLRHLDTWTSLDAAGRAAVLEEERGIAWQAELQQVATAADAHGFPLCAPDLSPPISWPYAWIDRRLQAFVAQGWLVDTGERRRSWPVYTWPAQGCAEAQEDPVSAETDGSR